MKGGFYLEQKTCEERNTMCFACGKNNPVGLKLVFYTANDAYVTEFTPGPEHQSYDGIMHGGIMSTLLDEIMGRYLYALGMNAVTAKLELRFRRPVPVGEKLIIRGYIVDRRGKTYAMKAVAAFTDGTIAAEANGAFVCI